MLARLGEGWIRRRSRGERRGGPSAPITERVQLSLVCAIVVLTPAFDAWSNHVWIGIALILLAIACLLTPFDRFAPAQSRCLMLVFATFAIFALVGIVQVLPAPDWIANPIWAKVAPLLDADLVHRISVRAAIPLIAITRCLLLLTSFLAGFSLGAGRRSSVQFLRVFAWSGAAYAAYGLLAEFFEPTQNLWGPKTAYVGSVTGPFIGRSTAAAYFGVAAIVWATLLTQVVHALALPKNRFILFVSLSRRESARVGIHALAFLICCAAMLGTKSRAALLLTFAGIVLAVACVYAHDSKQRRLLMVSGIVLACGLFLLVGVFGVGRIAAEGLFDPYRWATWTSSITAIETYPWLGTGWGTFQLIFPTFRTDEVSIWGIWERAHSTPLEIALEMGLPCAALVIGVSTYLFWRVFQAAASSSGERRFLLAATTGSASLVLLQTSIDFVFQISVLTIVFGTMFGAGVSRALSPLTHPTHQPVTDRTAPVRGLTRMV